MSKTTSAYNEYAQRYEQRWADYLRHTHNKFIEHLNFSESDRILDLSCGTGRLAQETIDRKLPFKQLTLNDPSTGMLDIAKSRLADHPGIQFSSATAHHLPFKDHSFDHVLSLNAFHNYIHQQRVICETARILKPGGSFQVLDWNRSGLFRMINALIRWWVPEHIDTRSAEECRQLLAGQGFRIEKEESWNYRYWSFFYLQGRLDRNA